MTIEEQSAAFDEYQEKFGHAMPVWDFDSIEAAAIVAKQHVEKGEPFEADPVEKGTLT